MTPASYLFINFLFLDKLMSNHILYLWKGGMKYAIISINEI